MLGYWNTQEGAHSKMGSTAHPSTSPRERCATRFPWPNSALLTGEVGDAVRDLKRELPGDLYVMGSGELIQTLMREHLIDEYLLFVHPLVLGTGRGSLRPAAHQLICDSPPARPRRPVL